MNKQEKPGMPRREFLRAGVTATVVATLGASGSLEVALAGAGASRHDFFLALGETLIPSSTTSPGFKSMESAGITQRIMSALSSIPDGDIDLFDKGAGGMLGATFTALDADKRVEYLRAILAGSAKVGDAATVKKLQTVLRLTKARAMAVFYHNFPEDRVKRDAKGNPVVEPGNTHLIFNPNTKELVTAWDTTRFGGPLSWEQEEERRKRMVPLWDAYEKEIHS